MMSGATLPPLVEVGNLIDLDDSSGPSSPSTLCASQNGDLNECNGHDSGVSTTSNGRCSADIMSENEESFEGVANGKMNGAVNLLDAPIESAARIASFDGMTPTPDRLSSNRLANHLFTHQRNRNGGSYGSRRSSFNSDVDMSVSESEGVHHEIAEISTSMQRIQRQLESMEESRQNGDDKQLIRVKQENAVLNERLRMLEEQLMQCEDRWKERLKEEKQRSKELRERSERERALESESLSLKLQLLERDHSLCQQVQTRLAAELDECRAENIELRDKVQDLDSQLNEVLDDHERAAGQLRRYQNTSDTEIKKRDAIIDELGREMEELQKQYNTTCTGSRRRFSNASERSVEFESEVQRLRAEQRRLQELNDELHAQLITSSVTEGRNLLRNHGASIADEIDSMTKDQMMDALKEQEVCNQKLRVYIDGILLRIVEMYPAILEIPPGHK